MEEGWVTADECSEDDEQFIKMHEEIIALRANVSELNQKLEKAEEDKTALEEELRSARGNRCRCDTTGTQTETIAQDQDEDSSSDESETVKKEWEPETIEVVSFSDSPNAQTLDLSSEVAASQRLPLSFPTPPIIPNVNGEMDNSEDMDEEVFFVVDAMTQTEEVAGPSVKPAENPKQSSSKEATMPSLVQQATNAATGESQKGQLCKNESNKPWHCVECSLRFEFFEEIKLHAKTMHGIQKLSLICFGESPEEAKKETKERKPHQTTGNTKPPNTKGKRGAGPDDGCGIKRQKFSNKDH